MGKPSDYTLVDVLAGIFSGVSNVLGKIKDVANQALNAIKAGLQYIANAVLGPYVDSYVFAFSSLLKSIGYVLQSMNFPFNIAINSNGIGIGTNQIAVERENLDMVFKFGSYEIPIFLGLGLPIIVEYDTLSAGADDAAVFSLGLFGIDTIVLLFALAAAASVKPPAPDNTPPITISAVPFVNSISIFSGVNFAVLFTAMAGLITRTYLMKEKFDDVLNESSGTKGLKSYKLAFFQEMLENFLVAIIGSLISMAFGMFLPKNLDHLDQMKFDAITKNFVQIGWEVQTGSDISIYAASAAILVSVILWVFNLFLITTNPNAFIIGPILMGYNILTNAVALYLSWEYFWMAWNL